MRATGRYDLPRGVVRACAGIVEAGAAMPPPFRRAIRKAEQEIGTTYGSSREREKLVKAVELSLTAQKEWPFDRLQAKYALPVSANTFWREKRKFCWVLAKAAGLIGTKQE